MDKIKVKINKKIDRVVINTDYIKLDSFLKFAGAAFTGGEAKIIISEGLVKVNGKVCTQRGKKLYGGDSAEYNGTVYKVIK